MENKPPKKFEGCIYLIIAIVFAVLGAVALGLSFTKLGVYALIACMLLEVVAITLLNLQKKEQDFKWLLYLKIATYLLFAAAIILFALGVTG